MWPVCTCMQANQGLSADRKERVTQGEMFVMEIWTAGVGKQSWRQDGPETTYFTHEITHTEESHMEEGLTKPFSFSLLVKNFHEMMVENSF